MTAVADKPADIPLRRVPLPTKIFYGIGATATGIKTRALGAFLMIFYNQVVGLPPALVSTIIMIALIADAFIDPSVGLTSDNFRSKWGRRHPFMYAAAVPYAVAFFILWNPPEGWSQGALVAFLLGALLLVRFFDSFFDLPAAALGPELAPNYNERTALISIRFFFLMMSGIAMTLLAYQVFMKTGADGVPGVTKRDGYFWFSLTGALVIFGAILISTLGTHSEIKHLRAAPERKLTPAVLFKEMVHTLSNRHFAFVTATGMMAAISLGLVGGLSNYFGLFFWEFDQNQLSLLVLASAGGALLAVMLATPLSAAFGKKPVALVCFFLAVVVSNIPISLRLLGLLPPNSDPIIFWIVFTEQLFYNGLGVICTIIVSSMIQDVVEDSEVKTGRRSEGLFISADNFFKKLVSGIGVFGAGIILAIAAFPQHARPGQVAPEVLQTMALCYIPFVIGLYAISITLLFFYRIDKATHEENLRRLRLSAQAAE